MSTLNPKAPIKKAITLIHMHSLFGDGKMICQSTYRISEYCANKFNISLVYPIEGVKSNSLKFSVGGIIGSKSTQA